MSTAGRFFVMLRDTYDEVTLLVSAQYTVKCQCSWKVIQKVSFISPAASIRLFITLFILTIR